MADANGQKFWMLSEREDWPIQGRGDVPGVAYDGNRRRLRLASQRLLPLWPNRWSLQLILPAEGDTEPATSEPFTFTAQPPVGDELIIISVRPASLRVSDTSTDLRLQVLNLGSQTRATVTLGFPDGRYTTRSAVLTAEAAVTGRLLALPLILNQSGAWSLRLTLPDGRQSSPYHFTVLSEIAAPLETTVEISGLESLTAPDTPTFQRLVFTGKGFQPGMRGRLTLPADIREISSGDIQSVSDTRFELFINLQTTATEAALRLLDAVPQAQDAFGTTARWDATSNRVVARGALPEDSSEVGIYLPPPAHRPTDLTMGYDGILYVVLHNPGENTAQVVMVDWRDRWQPFSVPLPASFVPWRLAAHPAGGVWALNRRDQSSRQLVRIQGDPLPRQAQQTYTADTFRPCEENPKPPRSHRLWSGNLDPEELGVAIATNTQGELALLSWVTGEAAQLRLWQGTNWQPPIPLEGSQHPFSFKWLAHRHIALLLPGLTSESVVYDLPAITSSATPPESSAPPTSLRPSGGFYPLRQYSSGHFFNSITQPPTYPTASGPKPLYPISTRAFAPSGSTKPQVLDSHNVQTVWHRLYLEAVIPAKTGIRVFLAATDNPTEPADDSAEWFEHRFGQRFAPGQLTAGDPPFDRQIPLGAWVSQASEVPYHSGLLGCPIQRNQQGLFTALIQRVGRKVRSLQGRYLWVRLELKGDGHNTPEIAALRAYASRFSYLNQYLPALYRESLFGPDADEPGTSSPADFLERFLDNFEGILTPLEDRIAQADLLTDARTVPAESLDWLGSWVGVAFDPGYPPARRRRLLQASPQLHRQRGTLNGLKHALDIGTDGAVQGGEIIVLEDFRLRRTFATILGANLADTLNPLTAGLSVSGNSFVGDTLVLGDETEREFLALFQADLPLENASDRAVIAAFFDRLAYRVTVYVHNDVTPQDLGLIRRIAELDSPAHVLTRVVTTTRPFLVTISALVGRDTYLRPEQPRQTVTLDRSQIGVYDILQQPASLDPRLTGSFNADLNYPLARAEVERSPLVGESFFLDGSNSQASAGRNISSYSWTLREGENPDE